jgi:hypothetical protein
MRFKDIRKLKDLIEKMPCYGENEFLECNENSLCPPCEARAILKKIEQTTWGDYE